MGAGLEGCKGGGEPHHNEGDDAKTFHAKLPSVLRCSFIHLIQWALGDPVLLLPHHSPGVFLRMYVPLGSCVTLPKFRFPASSGSWRSLFWAIRSSRHCLCFTALEGSELELL